MTPASLARTPDDAQAALDRMLQQAADEALERATARYALPGYCEEGGE